MTEIPMVGDLRVMVRIRMGAATESDLLSIRAANALVIPLDERTAKVWAEGSGMPVEPDGGPVWVLAFQVANPTDSEGDG